MVKMALKQDVDGNISDIAEYPYSLNQDVSKGWILAEDNSAFSITEKFNWTVRQSDNVLVHKSTGLTPEEESQKSATEMTNILMGNARDIEDIKQSITALTSMQLGGN